jgi:hypothetical protein
MSNYFDLNSKVYKGLSSLQDKFELFANYLLNDCVMYIGTQKYFLEEVEFYYHADSHKDSYVHQIQDQKTSQQWYFHKYKTGAYKSGTYKGLDLTFGTTTSFGGILIRAIENATTHEYVIGPCNVVNHILKQLNLEEVQDLVSNMKSDEAFSDKNPFYLKKEKGVSNTIFKGPRVGLSAKYPPYMFLNYRFLKSPNVTLKYKDTIVSVLYNEGLTANQIQEKTGISKATITKAITSYETGKTLNDVNGEKNINIMFGFYSK